MLTGRVHAQRERERERERDRERQRETETETDTHKHYWYISDWSVPCTREADQNNWRFWKRIKIRTKKERKIKPWKKQGKHRKEEQRRFWKRVRGDKIAGGGWRIISKHCAKSERKSTGGSLGGLCSSWVSELQV